MCLICQGLQATMYCLRPPHPSPVQQNLVNAHLSKRSPLAGAPGHLQKRYSSTTRCRSACTVGAQLRFRALREFDKLPPEAFCARVAPAAGAQVTFCRRAPQIGMPCGDNTRNCLSVRGQRTVLVAADVTSTALCWCATTASGQQCLPCIEAMTICWPCAGRDEEMGRGMLAGRGEGGESP